MGIHLTKVLKIATIVFGAFCLDVEANGRGGGDFGAFCQGMLGLNHLLIQLLDVFRIKPLKVTVNL